MDYTIRRFVLDRGGFGLIILCYMNRAEQEKANQPLIKELLDGTFYEANRRDDPQDRTLFRMVERVDQMIDNFLSDGDWKKFLREWAIYNAHAAFGLDKLFREKGPWKEYCRAKKFGGIDRIDEETYADHVWASFDRARGVLGEYEIDSYLESIKTSDHWHMIVFHLNEVDLICAMESDPKKMAEIFGRFFGAFVHQDSDADSREKYQDLSSKLLAFANS